MMAHGCIPDYEHFKTIILEDRLPAFLGQPGQQVRLTKVLTEMPKWRDEGSETDNI